jgi:predicted PurR-regulated permease PerM
VLGIDYSLPLAVMAFFGELLPYVGPILAGIPAVAVALTQSTTLALAVVIAYVAIQQIEGHVLTPVIMHSQTNLPPALVVVALTMGYSAGGILGAVAAIPLLSAGRVLLKHLAAPLLRCRRHAPHRAGMVH